MANPALGETPLFCRVMWIRANPHKRRINRPYYESLHLSMRLRCHLLDVQIIPRHRNHQNCSINETHGQQTGQTPAELSTRGEDKKSGHQIQTPLQSLPGAIAQNRLSPIPARWHPHGQCQADSIRQEGLNNLEPGAIAGRMAPAATHPLQREPQEWLMTRFVRFGFVLLQR